MRSTTTDHKKEPACSELVNNCCGWRAHKDCFLTFVHFHIIATFSLCYQVALAKVWSMTTRTTQAASLRLMSHASKSSHSQIWQTYGDQIFLSKICLSSKNPVHRLLTQRVGGVNPGDLGTIRKRITAATKHKRSEAIRSAGLINRHIDSTAMLGFLRQQYFWRI